MRPLPDRDLQPLPSQPDKVPWPTSDWPETTADELGGDAAQLDALLDELVSGEPHPVFGLTHGAAVVAQGRLVGERYGRRVVPDLRSLGENPPLEDLTAEDELLSWSMAKSITHLAVGAAVGDGALRIADPVPEPLWSDPDDPRGAITWDDLLVMRPGLRWYEEYFDLGGDALPDVITMLFGAAAADMAAYAASMELVHEPGSVEAYTYSSGTTNILAANLQRVLGLGAEAMDAFLHERIFDPIGMTSARASFDQAGTYIGSSYTHAALRDWCRFGLLAMRDGAWDGRRLVPEGWIDHGRTPRTWDEARMHGAHWWTWDSDDMPFGAHGFEGQRVICFPTRDVIVVRLGKTEDANTSALNEHIAAIASCFAEQ